MKETSEAATNSFVNRLKTLSIQDMILFSGILLLFVVASLVYGNNLNFSASPNILEGRFDDLQKNKMYKDIGYSYDLKLLESSQKYIIKADYANCLDLELFNAAVKKGDVISITTESNNQRLILSLKKKTTILMDINCVYAKTNHISIYIPILIALCILFIWWMRRKIKQDRANA
jgi:hypothetical protein